MSWVVREEPETVKIFSVVGARPQFIKAAALSRVLRREHQEILVHTGQHYDDNMSKVFFDELDIPQPDFNLEVGSGNHGAQTGAMLASLEKLLVVERPDWVLVYGDTNSTLAGALAASKLQIKLAHVEAGLRSFNRKMPEEINRVIADHLADLLICPSQTALDNLESEGIRRGVHVVGDVMADSLYFAAERARSRSSILKNVGVNEGDYLLATVHRAENSDEKLRLGNILSAFNELEEKVVFPVHPRTRKSIESLGFIPSQNILLIEPVGYLDMVMLEQNSKMILTDSGGIQKEAFWLGIPCITLRDETEWVETVQTGWNILVGADKERIIRAVKTFIPPLSRPTVYGEKNTAQRIVKLLIQ